VLAADFAVAASSAKAGSIHTLVVNNMSTATHARLVESLGLTQIIAPPGFLNERHLDARYHTKFHDAL